MITDRGQGLGNAIADVAELQRGIRGMASRSPQELAKAVQAYEKEVWPRGHEAVMGNLDNSIAIHDWELMQRAAVHTGVRPEGDTVRTGVAEEEGKE